MATSPSVNIFERDVSFTTKDVTSNNAAFAGLFRWGPVNEPVSVTTETALKTRFGVPTRANNRTFHAAANYLNYAQPLLVVRAGAKHLSNAFSAPVTVTGEGDAATKTTKPAILIKNDNHFDAVDTTGYSFIGRFPGALVNGLIVSVSGPEDFAEWQYRKQFPYAPPKGSVHIVVVDGAGSVTGTAGYILEKYSDLTFVVGRKKEDGTSAYVSKALADQSAYVQAGDLDTIAAELTKAPKSFTSFVLDGGVDDFEQADGDFDSALDVFANKETTVIGRIITSEMPDSAKLKAITIAENRQDSFAVLGPNLADILSNPKARENVIKYFSETINVSSSYYVVCDQHKYIYDKYNDVNIWISCDSDVAGLIARTKAKQASWYSPAGTERGQLKNVLKLAWNPDKSDRDAMYPYNINSIVSFPGEGVVLFGDRTGLKSSSSFAAINVRALFIDIEKNVATTARDRQFSFNDQYTRAQAANDITKYLATILAGRGIYDYKVVCDETNNTSAIIDSEQMVIDVYIKPTRVASTINISFVNTPTSLSFAEIA